MSRVRYSFSIRGDAQIGPGGTLYSAIGARVYDGEHRDVGHVSHVSHVAQSRTDLEIEVSVYGIDKRSLETVAEESWQEGYDEGADEAREEGEEAIGQIMSRLANWPVDEFSAVMLEAAGIAEHEIGTPIEVFKSQIDVPKLIAAITKRAEG